MWHPRNLTITQRLLALTALAMLPAAAVVVFYIVSLHQQREREVHAQARQYAQLASLEMERIISGAQGLLQALAHTEAVQNLDAETCDRYLAAVSAEQPRFLGFEVADASGIVRCASVPVSGSVRIDDRAYFTEAVETHRFVVGGFTRLKINGQPSLPLALPLTDEGGDVAGAIVAALDLGWLGKRLRERSLLEGSSITVADSEGVIIAREPFPERFVGMRIPDAFQYLVRASSSGTLEVESLDGTRRILGYYPPDASGSGLYVSFGLSTDAAFESVMASTYRSMAIALLAAAAVFVIAWAAGKQLFQRPVRRLLDTISAWRTGDDSARTGIAEDGSELSTLAAAIDGYMDELVAGRAARRRAEEHRTLLVRELDHRVKNILATVKAIASQSFGSEPSRADLDAFAARLSAMANAHDMLMSENWATAELRRTLEIALTPFGEEGQRRFSLEGPSLMIRARAALTLSMAVHELCTNAIKYGALSVETGHVAIEWSIEARPQGDVFLFSWTEHDGPPVTPPERTGFGTRMIERVLAAELSGKVDLRFPPAGLVCTVECAVSSILGEQAGAASTEEAA